MTDHLIDEPRTSNNPQGYSNNAGVDSYFTNLTLHHKKLFADHLRYIANEEIDSDDEQAIRMHAGDTLVQVLDEDEDALVIFSIDSGTRTHNIICKRDLSQGTVREPLIWRWIS